ncbi:MAG: cytochrome-c peroxidase [Gammaproteobacteria bacterium]|nr:cytochrome-c peroxidase [Gammaproteobacteria bacterium]
MQLRDYCPPGFELAKQAGCRLRSLYQSYPSLGDHGVGGTHTGLPSFRDGFSPQQIDLGRYLFFDPLLSGDNSLACASCHDPYQAFTDGNALSPGASGQKTLRSAPSLWNSAFLSHLFWDARASSLEQQATGPLYSPREMNASPQQLLGKLRAAPHYQKLYGQAFAGTEPLSLENTYRALAAFQASLVSLHSRYDEYAHGNHNALSTVEIKGLNVFRSFVARCAECHTPPLFTNNQLAVIGVPEPAGRPLDLGAGKTFANTALNGAFKVPSLRNIAQTAPYMHSGVFSSLHEVVEFYNGGRGHALPAQAGLQLHWHIVEPDLQAHEIDALVAFLRTLSDQRFLPDVPRKLPSGLAPVMLPGAPGHDINPGSSGLVLRRNELE